MGSPASAAEPASCHHRPLCPDALIEQVDLVTEMQPIVNEPNIDRTELTPQQSNIVRWVLDLRAKNGMAAPTNNHIPGAVEFATLVLQRKVASEKTG